MAYELNQEPEHQTGQEEQVQPQLYAAEPDWFLQLLVNFANDSALEIGIIVQTGGFLVSGFLCGGAEYFDGLAAEFASAFPEQTTAESMRAAIASWGDTYRDTDVDEAPKPLPYYIHLKNARFHNTAGNPIPGNRGVWWRGRLSVVSGFTLGNLGPPLP